MVRCQKVPTSPIFGGESPVQERSKQIDFRFETSGPLPNSTTDLLTIEQLISVRFAAKVWNPKRISQKA